jgi:hypothetical protein
VNARIYSLLLRLYPAELREDFAGEMMQVFIDDLENARRRRGFAGVARVWWRSLKELCQIALPAAAKTPKVMVPLSIYLFQALWLLGVLRSDPTLSGRVLYAAMIPALTTFIALKVNDSEVPDPPILSRRA